MKGSGVHLARKPATSPSRLLLEGNSDVTIISCVGFPFKQDRNNRKDGQQSMRNMLEMGKTLLQQLYEGEIYPEKEIVPKTPEYREVNRAVSNEKRYFYDVLNDKQRQHFEILDDLRCRSSTLYAYENLAYGFRLGMGLMMETLDATPVHTEE